MTARPDYARLRRFLARGGHLQRDADYVTRTAHWRSATRDGFGYAAETCEWLASLSYFRIDGAPYHLAEPRPGIFCLAEGAAPEDD